MDTAETLVAAGSVALIGFILWFFFGPKKTVAASGVAGGVQKIDVAVSGAYAPDRIEVEAGRPVQMNFLRKEENACTAQVIFPDFGLVKDLPVGRNVPVEFTPQLPGEYPFHCGMNMVRGKLVVRPAAGGVRAGRIDD